MKYVLSLETEDINELSIFMNAHKYKNVLYELMSQIRTDIKHSDKETIFLEELREKIIQILDDEGLSLDDVFH
jgi:hypothetical protein